MSQHLAILKGPQGEKIPVVCASEQEARALEARAEPCKARAKCPTCGRQRFDDSSQQAT